MAKPVRYRFSMDRRTDRLAAVQVDLAVNVAAVFGMSAGVRVLHAEGISPAIVQRVIIDGGPRRGVRPRCYKTPIME